ncbi:MAG: signal recognition particle-docking protein FtsY [Chloroflexota bacterium]|nr:signal recognition particle-docking protein FtsY [Chloroflexota bacterium]
MFGLFKRDKRKTEEGVRRSREGLFGRLAGLLRGARLDQSLWDEMEEVLVSADVGVATATELVVHLQSVAKEQRLTRPEELLEALKARLVAILDGDGRSSAPWPEGDAAPKPFVVLVVGVNGVGKTTSIAKLASQLKASGKSVVLGAADTFRAAAIEQLQIWGQRVGVDVIAHRPGADPGAVAFDAYQAAKARGADFLIIDTAGRIHTKTSLMEELKKIGRVLARHDPSAPHQVLLVLDATTGLNGLSQAKEFTAAVRCSGVFLAKMDGTARGGIVVAIRKELGLPILFIGTGERPEDVAPFDAQEFVEALLAPGSDRGLAPEA